MDPIQRSTAKAIVNIFETGRVRGNYGAVTLIPGDPGHLTYGRSQTTLASGNLFLLIRGYCSRGDAQFGADLTPYLTALANCDLSLDRDATLRDRLHQAGDDPAMQQEQDRFFDAHYFEPACKIAVDRGLQSSLAQTVVYDGCVQGGFARVASRVAAAVGATAPALSEHAWVAKYVDERRAWLQQLKQPLPRTIYRMDAFKALIDGDKWDLPLPLDVHGVTITAAAFSPATPPSFIRAAAVDPGDPAPARVVVLTTPYMRGSDVELIQQALDRNGFPNGTAGPNGIKTYDGIYGPFTEVLMRQFQRARGMRDDGVIGPLTRAALGL
jgi:chitosanase